jgi:hypothetical protein
MNPRRTAGSALLACLLAACSLNLIQGSGNIVSEDRSVSGFDAVVLTASGNLSLSQGETEALTLEADDNLLPYLKSEVQGGTLTIRFDRDNWDQIYRPSQPIQYHLTVKDLSRLEISGSVDVTAPELNVDQLEVTVSGSGDLRIDQLQANKLVYVISGSGNADLAGQAAEQDITISGSGNYHAGDLASQTVRIGISGSGSATLWAQAALDAGISGSGSIDYYGGAAVSADTSGSGSITSLGDK